MEKKNNALSGMSKKTPGSSAGKTAQAAFENPSASMCRTTVYIPADLQQRIKIQAVYEKRSVSSIVVDLLETYLSEKEV
ncbi:hypothetical protein [Corynebacterium sp. CCM 9203]|uniref:ribbon-helix-helix domain-containing protein n=1 Tax=Corynebacterium sp. CCM 9203 TaxID=3057615 RepID=UPI003523AB71